MSRLFATLVTFVCVLCGCAQDTTYYTRYLLRSVNAEVARDRLGVTALVATNVVWGSNVIGAVAQATHATNADYAAYATNAGYAANAGSAANATNFWGLLSSTNLPPGVLTNNDTRAVAFTGLSLTVHSNLIMNSNGIVRVGKGRMVAASNSIYGFDTAIFNDVVFDVASNRVFSAEASTNLWDDIVFGPEAANPIGLPDAAALVANSGQSADQLALEFSANKVMFIVAQMPHTWVAGTTIYPHMHFQPQSNLAITNVWRVAYSVSDIGGVFPASTVVTNQITIAAGSQWKMILQNIPTNGISMTGKVGPSTVIRLYYWLLSTTENMHLLSYDVHYRWGGSPVISAP